MSLPVARPRLAGVGGRRLAAASALLCCLLWAVLAPPARAAEAAQSAATALEADLRALLAQERLAGLVYASVEGEATRVGALGLADASTGRPLRADAKVHVGSIAKTLTALAVLRLVTQGRLDLDAPLQALLPGSPLGERRAYAADAAAAPVRLRHLIDMTAGLGDVRLWHIFSARNTPDMPLAEAFERDPALWRLRSEPGTRFSYSNLSFTLAAMVIEAAAHERYEPWAERELLRPLGMADSRFGFTSQQGPHTDARLAWGHIDDGTPVAALPSAVRPAAQFTTTAPDMARLMRFLMSDGRVDGRAFIRPDLLRAMGRATTTDAARAGLRAGYGLGLFTRDRHGAVGRCHGGSVVGFRAMFCVFPERQRGFFIAHNTDRESARYARFDERMTRHLGVATMPLTGALAEAAPLPAPAAWDGRYVPAPGRFDSWALLDRIGWWRLAFDGPQARLTQVFGEPQRLRPAGAHLLQHDDRLQPSLVLLQGADGRRLISHGGATLQQADGAALAALAASLLAGALAAVYWLVVPVLRPRAHGRRSLQPASMGVALLLLAVAGLAAQPWQRLGDLTVFSAALAAASVALPLALLWQALRTWQHRRRLRLWQADLLAACCGLQAVGLLAAYGLWPVLLWRL